MQRPPDSGGAVLAMGEAGASTACGGRAVCSGNIRYVRRAEAGEQEGMWRIPASRACAEGSARTGRGPSSSAACVVASARARRQVDGEKAHGGHRSAECVYASHASTFPVPLRAKITTEPPQLSGFCPAPRRHSLSSCRLQPSGPLSPGRSSRGSRRFAARAVRAFLFLFLSLLLLLRLLRGCSLLAASTSGRQSAEPVSTDARHGPLEDSSLTSRVRCGLELPVLAPFSLLAVSCASAAFLAEPRERDEPTEGVSTPGALPWLLDVAGYRRASGREAADERRRGRGEAEPSRVPKLTGEDVDGGSESGWREEGRQASGSAVAPLAALTEELVEAPVRSDRVQSSHGGAAASNADMHPWRSLLATGVANSVEAATSPFASQPLVGGDALGGQPASAASESPYLHSSQPPFGLAFFAQPACSDPSSRSSSPYPSSAAAVLSTLPESSRPAAPTRSVPASRAPETSSASPPLPPADASSEGSPGAVPAREAPPAPAAVPSALPAFCGEKEDLSACDVVKDGTCYILAASSTRAAELLGPPTEPAQPHADEEEAAKFDGKRGERGELKLMERPGPPTSEVSGTREERRANGESPRRDVASSERDAHAGRGPTDRPGQLQNVRLLKDGLRIVSRGRIVIDADVQLLCRSALYAEERAKLRRLEEAAKRTAEKKRKYRADLASGRNRGGARRGGDANRSAGPRKPKKRSLLGFLFSAPRREQDDLFSLGEHADADNAGELRSPAESSPLPPSVSAAAAASQVDLRPPARESHAFPPEAASSFTAPALAASSGAPLVQDRVELCSGDVILFSPRSRLHCREIFLLSEREIVLQAGAEISANATSLLSADAIAQHRQAVGGAGSEASRADASTAARQQQTGEAAGVSREPDALHLDGGSRGGPLSADADANKGLQAAELTDARRRPTADGSASTQDKRETSSASSSSAWGAIASLRSDSIRLRGGSYGGVGGRLAQATCQDEGADDPHTSLPTHELTYGSPFLPVHLGVAGRLVAESAVALAVSGPRASQPSDTRLPNALEAPERAGIEAPRGGGLVLMYAGDRLVLDGGRISASGEEGWHADPQTEFSASGDGPAGAGARGSGERGEKDAEVRASAGRSDDKGTRLAAPGDNGSSSARAGEVGADKIKGCRTKTKSCSPAETEATTGQGKAGDAGARRREAGARSPVEAAAPRWLQTLTQWLVPPPLRRGDPKNQRWPPRGAGGGDDEVCDTRSEGVAQRAEHNCEPGKLTFPPLPAQATAGSGGSILLISGDIHLSRPLEGGGRLVAQGGGCRSAASLEARFRERQGRREFLFPSHPATANAEGERRRRGPTPGAGLRPDTAAQGVMGASRGSRDPRSFTRPEALAWEVPGAIPQAVEAEGCPDDRRRGWSCRGGGRIWKERRRQAKHRQQQRKAATAEASEARREAYVDDWLRDQAWGTALQEVAAASPCSFSARTLSSRW
ncbi:hypothetical protein BESB_021020 [Besnoitia besnoiti]|uniref:Uncharacterized protein n=1 Tax=Besnoitia besnoiti TaxID=94643 RepID=A0A2A9M777_BESBE|nr:hypothetical protein BESB_021020 [Besnoitia besnoiti]PFH32161.1 hypothetical protein BESB_021020 [Besnoitia besnoiti]